MKVLMSKNSGLVEVIRQKSDPRFSNDSAFWYGLRNYLRAKDHDVIKKLMCKDGHMVSDTQHYVRARNGSWCVHDPSYQVRNACTEFNAGHVVLRKESL